LILTNIQQFSSYYCYGS